MRIALLTYPNISYPGGGQRSFFILASKLRRINHIPEIVTTDAGPVSTNIRSKLEAEGIPLTELKHFYATTMPFGFKKLLEVFRRNDLVYFEYWAGGLEMFVLLCSKLSNTPVITLHHGHLSTSMRNRHWLVKMMFKILGPRNIRIGRLLGKQQVVCLQDKTDIAKWVTEDRISYIPDGVEIESFRKAEKEATFTILFVSRLVKEKGVDLLPAIIDRLETLIKDFKLVIAGSGQMKEFVEELSKTSDKVTYLGEIDGEQKSRLFSKAHLLIAPTINDTFLITGIEAMASYTPVVIFDIPGPTDYVKSGHNGYVAKTLEDFVSGIILLHSMWKSDRRTYSAILENCRITAQEFDWDTVIIPSLGRLFSSVIE